MFDDLHDPDPPEFRSHHFHAITVRARTLRRQRYALVAATCVLALGIGTSAVVALGADDPSELAPTTDPPTLPIETTAPSPPTTTAPDCAPTTTTLECVPAETTPLDTEPPATEPIGTKPPVTQPPGCTNLGAPLLGISDGDLVRIDDAGQSSIVVSSERAGGAVQRGLEALDGTIWLQVAVDGATRIATVSDDADVRTVRSGDVALKTVGTRGGTSVAAVVDLTRDGERWNEGYGRLELIDADGTAVQTIEPAATPTGGIDTVGVGGDVVALGSIADLGEAFDYVNSNGAAVSLFDPTGSSTPDPADDRYGMPPFFTSPIPTPEGDSIAWLEGPDTSNASPTEPTGEWELIIANASDGSGQLRLPVGERDERLISADFDGRWFVANFGEGDPGGATTPTRSVIFDRAYPPVAQEICGAASEVSLRRLSVGSPSVYNELENKIIDSLASLGIDAGPGEPSSRFPTATMYAEFDDGSILSVNAAPVGRASSLRVVGHRQVGSGEIDQVRYEGSGDILDSFRCDDDRYVVRGRCPRLR